MNGLLSYSGVVTKIRAMQSHFFDEDGFREIVSLPSVPAIAAYLKKNPNYAQSLSGIDENQLHRGQLEIYLNHSLLLDFEKLYRFADATQRHFLRRYARRYEIRVLKDLLTHLFEGSAIGAEYSAYDEHFEKYSDLDIKRLRTAGSLQEFIAALKGSPYEEPMQEVLRQNPDAKLFEFETALDLFHFRSIWKDRGEIAGKGENEKILEMFYGTKFDLLNLWYIYRARTYYQMDKVSIYALTIPVLYKLQKTDIQALVEADTEEAFQKALKATYYGRTRDDLDPKRLQYLYTRICRDIIKKGTERHPYSIASLYSYLYLKEHEVYRLITSLECVRYGMKPEEALKYVTQR